MGASAAAGARGAAPASAGLTGLGDLGVVLDAGGGGAEYESVLPVVEGVQQEDDVVRIVFEPVPPVVVDHDLFGPGIETDDADVEVLVVEGDPHLGVLAGRPSFLRILLDEPGGRLYRLPQGFVDPPVQTRRLRNPPGPEGSCGAVALRGVGLSPGLRRDMEGKRRHQQGHQGMQKTRHGNRERLDEEPGRRSLLVLRVGADRVRLGKLPGNVLGRHPRAIVGVNEAFLAHRRTGGGIALHVEDDVVVPGGADADRHVVQSQRVPHLPGHHVIGAGGIAAHTQAAQEIALTVIEAQTPSGDVDAPHPSSDHGVLRLSMVFNIAAIGDPGIDRMAELEPEETASRLCGGIEIGRRKRQARQRPSGSPWEG